jgi:hypothetical protein
MSRRRSGWLNFPADISPDLPEPRHRSKIRPDAALDMEEYLHYSNPTNGGIGIIVPGSLLLIPPPHELPEGCIWLDKPVDGFAGSRRERVFSPAFYADLLADEFGISVVLHTLATVSHAVAYDPAPFCDRDITVDDLLGGGGLCGQLQGVDKLLTLISAAEPRAVAVHGAPDGSGVLTGPLLTVLAVVLLRQHGFPSASSAVAWLLMANPSPDATEAEEVSRGLEGLTLIRSMSAQAHGPKTPSSAAAAAAAAEAVWLLRRTLSAPAAKDFARSASAAAGVLGGSAAAGAPLGAGEAGGQLLARSLSAEGHTQLGGHSQLGWRA